MAELSVDPADYDEADAARLAQIHEKLYTFRERGDIDPGHYQESLAVLASGVGTGIAPSEDRVDAALYRSIVRDDEDTEQYAGAVGTALDIADGYVMAHGRFPDLDAYYTALDGRTSSGKRHSTEPETVARAIGARIRSADPFLGKHPGVEDLAVRIYDDLSGHLGEREQVSEDFLSAAVQGWVRTHPSEAGSLGEDISLWTAMEPVYSGEETSPYDEDDLAAIESELDDMLDGE